MVSRVPIPTPPQNVDSAGQAEVTDRLQMLQANEDTATVSVYGSHFAARSLPRWEMPEGSMPKEIAYRMIKDELTRDGTPALNLASFVTTYMEEEAEKLMLDAMPKNYIDYEEYPATTDIQNRCVAMIAHILNIPRDGDPADQSIGTSTVGSSEAIMLAVLAMKKRWQLRRKAQGLPFDKPNIVMNSAVQVCWEKAARYFDVEERYVYCTTDRYVIDPIEAVNLVDENTIGICAILGTTYTGEYEDVKAINDELVKRDVDCGIHVDAASGGFVAPFVRPEFKWDFRLPKVISINLSGHKYGLVYPGVGWCIWRSQAYLPKDLIFNINYLGADQASFTLNFSRGASQIVGQYYQLIRLGKEGYRAIMLTLTQTADYLSRKISDLGCIVMSRSGGNGLPLVAFRLDPARRFVFDEYALAHRLREKGWVVPAYTLAPHAETIKLMRVVVREDFSKASCDDLVHDLESAIESLAKIDPEQYKAIREYVRATRRANHRGSHRHHQKTTLQVDEHYKPQHEEGLAPGVGDSGEHADKMKVKTRGVC